MSLGMSLGDVFGNVFRGCLGGCVWGMSSRMTMSLVLRRIPFGDVFWGVSLGFVDALKNCQWRCRWWHLAVFGLGLG